MRGFPSILLKPASVMRRYSMTDLGKCSQANYAQPMGIMVCNGVGAYRMNIPKGIGGKPSGWVIVCEPCESRFGDKNLELAGYVQRKDRSWKPPKNDPYA